VAPERLPCAVMAPRLLLSLVLAAVLVAACNSGIAPTITPTGSAAPASGAPTTEPVTSDEPTEPPASEEAPSEDPGTETPPIDEPSASASSGPSAAAACSGNDKNRDFFVDAAAALTWPVYCAVLPAGWFVNAGEYRRAGGGRLEITYKGPGGASLELREGAFCTGEGCVQPGAEAGEATFGDKTGTLVGLDDGGWVIDVDRSEPIAWMAIGHGMDEQAFRAMAAALTVVSG
jgi:hypothetical protein